VSQFSNSEIQIETESNEVLLVEDSVNDQVCFTSQYIDQDCNIDLFNEFNLDSKPVLKTFVL
jgi:hypothetical protein